MQLEQRSWTARDGWSPGGVENTAQLVLLFGGTQALAEQHWREALERSYPGARLFGCSTAGEIMGTRIYDDTLVATAIRFASTELRIEHVAIDGRKSGSEAAGAALARSLPPEGLRHVFVLSDGQKINGSELVRGMMGQLPPGVRVTGGLAGDGARFKRTLVFADDEPQEGVVAAAGLYGQALRVGFGSLGGWDPFGPKRTVTRSEGNVLIELDGRPALELYRTYLGEHAAGLPATGLLFPLSICRPGDERTVVRTILNIDEEQQSLTFAGDMPEGSVTQLMKANFERLIDGAAGAAEQSHQRLGKDAAAELAVLISCVGRKLVLGQRTEEEVESVRDVLGAETALTGFYSYGEICPASPDGGCELHNQTMTITTFREEST